MNSIPLFKIYWDEEDIESITQVIRRGSYWATGPEIPEFEKKVAAYVGTRYGVAFNSGTSALHAALLACNIGNGDEVIVPSFTFIATANAVLFVDAKPVFAEIEGTTYGLDPEDVKEKITPKTKAIVPVHYAGCPCIHTRVLKEIAEDHGLILVEDAAESLGAQISNKMVGTFGNAALLSFCQNKIITTGEGGMILTDDTSLYNKLKLLRSHGREEHDNYFTSSGQANYVSMGYNFRISTIVAALGLSQLTKVETVVNMRQKNAEYYNSNIKERETITLPLPPAGFSHVYQLYTILIEHGLRDDLQQYLAQKSIASKIYFEPVHLTAFYRKRYGYSEGYLPVTEKIAKKVLTLPMYPALEEKELEYIVQAINGFW